MGPIPKDIFETEMQSDALLIITGLFPNMPET